MNRFGRDMTVGSIPRHLLSIAMPMLIGNLMNTGYQIVNTLWLGRIIGDKAIAATAVSFPVIFVFVALAAGATMVTTIMVSQYYGAKNNAMVEKTVGTSFFIAIVLSILLSTGGILSSEFILRLLNTPDNIMDMASGYLKIVFIGFGFQYFSFLITSILRGLGDTKTPLLFMAAGVAVNAILDPLLIIGIGPFPKMGLNGAAWASVISVCIAVFMGFIYLRTKGSIVAPRMSLFRPDAAVARQIFKIGLPSSAQQGLVSIGMAAITSFVNGFGSLATAAFGVCGRIDSVAFMPAMSIGMAVSALAGQNLGAQKPERVRQVFSWGLLMTITITGTCALCYVLFPRFLMSIFVTDEQVIKLGISYLTIVGPSCVFFAIMFVSNGVINGSGKTMITLVFTLLSMWGLRVPLAALLSRTSLGITGVWIAMSGSFLITMSISLLYYRSGRWAKSAIIKPVSIVEEPIAVVDAV
jgi:putative MATE family efflux protein